MKVLLRRNVQGVGKIGDVVNVKDGYARNYLIPQQMAYIPTEGNIKRVEAEREAYLAELAMQRKEFEARAALLQGKEITISSRANEEGHLYGSVGPAQIVAALAAQGLFIEAREVRLDSPIRRLDKYDVKVHFTEEVEATIHVWVVPIREEGSELPAIGPADEEADQA